MASPLTCKLVVVQEQVLEGGQLPQLRRNGIGQVVVPEAQRLKRRQAAQFRHHITCRSCTVSLSLFTLLPRPTRLGPSPYTFETCVVSVSSNNLSCLPFKLFPRRLRIFKWDSCEIDAGIKPALAARKQKTRAQKERKALTYILYVGLPTKTTVAR